MITSQDSRKKTDTKISNILISQPKPENEKSPYYQLKDRHKINIDFRPFIHVEGISAKDFRKSKIYIDEHSAVIFTSLNAVVNFFRICTEMRINMPQETKYFCMTEAIALYLQKYIEYRKRKVFFGNGKLENLTDLLKKHKELRFLFPCSDIHKKDIPAFLESNKFNFSEAVIYKTVCSDLSDMNLDKYDMVVFFSPSGIRSLFQNFPDFEQNNTRIAAFGSATAKAVIDAGLRLDIKAPVQQAPSMTMALEKFLQASKR
ncbi:MAG: uroporphyrinogen-III synthase [Bacteroidetes bacterium]|nr:uroporphyrinogen-III synthase [Bacteroidota bacterium]